MAEDRVKTVYDNLVSAGYKFKDEQHFRDIVADSTSRRKLYDRLSQDYDLADFDTFSNDLGVSQSQASSVAKKDETLTGNAEPKNAVLPSGEAEGTVVDNYASDGGLTPDSPAENGGFGADGTMQNGGLAPDSLMPKNDSTIMKHETTAPDKKNVAPVKVDGRWQLPGKEVSVKPEETTPVSGVNTPVTEEKTTPLTNEQMMSGIKQASKELNATSNAVESVADAIIKERTENPAESFQRNLEEEQKAKMNNVVVQRRLDKSLGIDDAISEYKKGVEDVLTKVAMSGGGQAVEGMRNNAMSPDVMSEKVAKGIIDNMTPEDLADLSYRSGISAENMAEYITQSVQDKVYGAAYNDAKPKTDAEYALMNTVMNSLIGKITVGAKAGRVQNEIMRAAAQDYDAGIGTRLATGAATMLLDLPSFALPGKAAGAIVGGTGRFSRALIESSLKKKMLNGAITFGGYDLMSEIVDQAQSGEVDVLGGALDVAKGAILGATVGGLSYGTRAATYAMKGGYKYLRPAVNAIGLGAEAAVFTGAGELEKAANGQFNRDEVIGDYLETLGTFGILRLSGYAGNVMSMGAKNTFDYLKQNGELPKGVKFSNEEKDIIEDAFGKKYSDVLKEMGNANASNPDSFRPYLSFIYNMEIPFSARQKVAMLFEGKPTTPLATYAKQEGNRVVTYDAEGGMLKATEFENEADAKAFYNETIKEAEKNFIQQKESSLVNMMIAKNHPAFRQAACERAGISEEESHMAIEKMRNGEQLTDVEQRFIDEFRELIKAQSDAIRMNEALGVSNEEAERISSVLNKNIEDRTSDEQRLVGNYIAKMNALNESLYSQSREAQAQRVLSKAWDQMQSETGRKRIKAKDIYDESVTEGEAAGNEVYDSGDGKAFADVSAEAEKAAAVVEATLGKPAESVTEEDIANVLMNGNEEQQSAAAAFARTNSTMETIANRVNVEISKAQEETERIWRDRVNGQGEIVEATLSDGRKGWIRNKGSNGNVFFVDESGKVTSVPEAMVSSSNVLGKLSDVVAGENERIANEITADYDRRFSGVGELGAGQTYEIVLPNGEKQTVTIQGQDATNGGWVVAYSDGEVETISESDLVDYIGEARRAGFAEEASKMQPMRQDGGEEGGNAPSTVAEWAEEGEPSMLEGSATDIEPKTEEPKTEEPKTEEPKTEEPKTEERKTEERKTEERKTEERKTEEPKSAPAAAPTLNAQTMNDEDAASTFDAKTMNDEDAASKLDAQAMNDEDAEIDAQPLTREEGIALSILKKQNEGSLAELTKAYKKGDNDEIKRLTNLINAGMPNGVRVTYDETTKSAGLSMRRSQYEPSSQLTEKVEKYKADEEKMNELLLRTDGKTPTLEDALNEEEMDVIMYFSHPKKTSSLIKDEYERLQKMRLQGDIAGDISVEDRIAAVEELSKKYWKHNLGTAVALNGQKGMYMTGEDALEQYLAEGYDEVKEILNDNEPKNLREYVTREILGAVFNAEDLKKQITGSKSDFRWLGKHMRTNGGETIEGVAHKIWENLPNTYKSEPHDDSIIRDIIIDVLSSYDNMTSLRTDALNPQISRARDAFDAIRAQEQREFEQVFYDKHHLAVDEARDYIDVWTESVKDLENTPEELYESDFNSNIAEDFTEHGRIRKSNNQSDSSEGNAPAERSGSNEAGVPEDTSVLPREQAGNGQRTEVSDGRNSVEERRSEEDDSAVPNGPVSNEEERGAATAAGNEPARGEQVGGDGVPSGEAEGTMAGRPSGEGEGTKANVPSGEGEGTKAEASTATNVNAGTGKEVEPVAETIEARPKTKDEAIAERVNAEIDKKIEEKQNRINVLKNEIDKKRREYDRRNGLFGDNDASSNDMFPDTFDSSKENFDESVKQQKEEINLLLDEIKSLNEGREKQIAEAVNADKAQTSLFDPVEQAHKISLTELRKSLGLPEYDKYQDDLEQSFVDRVSLNLIRRNKMGIVELRKIAKEIGLDAFDGKIQELTERAIINTASVIAKDSTKSLDERYDAIVDLYTSQPTISMRDATRVELQQYSTPIPIAFLADEFVKGINPRSVLEPSGGNGMMVFGLDPRIIHINEIDAERLENLVHYDYDKITNQDGREPFSGKYDAIVTNPPFGPSPAKQFGDYKIGGLDQLMILNALESMKPNGRAAIIMGGHTSYASNGSLSGNDRMFYGYLYNNYNVSDIVNISGNLYAKQGTKYPIRMILIDGKRNPQEGKQYAPVQSKAKANEIQTFDELKNRINELLLQSVSTRANNNNNEQSDNRRDVNGGSAGASDTSLPAERQRPVSGTTDADGVRGKSTMASSERNAGEPSKRGGSERSDNDELDNVPVSRMDQTPSSDDRGERPSGGGERTFDGDNRKPVNADGLPSGVREQGKRDNGRQGTNTVSRGARGVRSVSANAGTGKSQYPSRSNAPEIGSVIPEAVLSSTEGALSQFDDIDQFVADKLGYDTKDSMQAVLAAEQIDSVALAIKQIENNNAFIIGDMTGVGKGRQAASIIRYAHHEGKIPIFVTVKPELFSDIYRDLNDIGCGDYVPYIISDNTRADMTDKEGKTVYKHKTNKELQEAIEKGELPAGYDYVVMTYSQVQLAEKTVSSKNSTRTYTPNQLERISKQRAKNDFLRKLAADNIIVLDESHNASGSDGKGNVASVMMDIVRASKGTVFLSATYAKTPANMPIYAVKTAMSEANVTQEELIKAIEEGGVPLQEIMSQALTQSHQMIRRERSFDGVKIDWHQMSVNTEKVSASFNEAIGIMNKIIKFQKEFVDNYVDQVNEELAEIQESAHETKSANLGFKSPPALSKLFNLSRQLMFSQKADYVADFAIDCLSNNEKPVIAVSNTMETFINDFPLNEEIDAPTYAIALERALQGIMKMRRRNEFGKEVVVAITPQELGANAETAYNELVEEMKNMSSGLSISPIDVIIKRITDAGYTVGEMTGRDVYVEYKENGKVEIKPRKNKDKKAIARDFNNGKIDVVLMNRSASTGISLHASTQFADQRQRHMISAQAELDVNEEVQMRGRIDRTGQIHRGKYTYIISPVPAEQRLLMMLQAKLKSLDANTTADQKSEFNKMEIVDFLNKYGDEVIKKYLEENSEFNDAIYDPLGLSEEKSEHPQASSVSAVVSGRVALLPVSEQEKFYNEIAERYTAYIDYLDSMGANDLEIKSLPFAAKTTKKQIFSVGKKPGGTNVFADNAYLETVQVNVLRKPMTSEEVKSAMEAFVEGMDPWEYRDYVYRVFDAAKEEKINSRRSRSVERLSNKLAGIKSKYEKAVANGKKTQEEANEAYAKEVEEETSKMQSAQNAFEQSTTVTISTMQGIFNQLRVGTPSFIPLDYTSGTGYTRGIVIGYKFGAKLMKDGKYEGNITPSSTSIVFATLDGRRRLEIPMSQTDELYAIINNNKYGNNSLLKELTLEKWDTIRPSQTTKTEHIITGNIIQALSDARVQRGKLISYTTDNGRVKQGILLPQDANITDVEKQVPIEIGSVIKQIAGDYQQARCTEGILINPSHLGYGIMVPKSRKKGGEFYLNPSLRDLSENDFYQRGNYFIAEYTTENFKKAIEVLNDLGVRLLEKGKMDEVNPDDDPDGGGGGPRSMYDEGYDYEVDKSNPAYATFAELNKRWSDMVLDVSKREISDDEKISIIDDAVEGMVNEMLDEYKTVDYSVISKRNFEEVMRKNGCKKNDIEEAKDMIAEGAKGIYSSVANKLFVVSSNINNFAKFFEAYDHERQHQWNRSHSWYVLKMKDIFNKDLDKARYTLAKISGTNKYDSLDNIGDIADEIIAHGITKSNLRGFEGKHLEGADEDVVKLLKDIYYEQTNDADLSKSRFLKRVVRGDGGGTSAVQQNVFGESGTLEEQGSKPAERGKEATWNEIRAERIKPFVKDGRVTLTEDNVANYLYNVAGKLQHNIFDKTSKFLKESIDKESGERYFEVNKEKAKVLLPEINKELDVYRNELLGLIFGANARVSDAARVMLENEIYNLQDARDYYRRIAYGTLDWRTAERPKFLLDGEKTESSTKKAADESNRIKAEMQDIEYYAAVERGDTETAQAMVNAKASRQLDDFSRLQDDTEEVGFKYHRGEAPKKIRTMYAVFNVFPDGFRAAYAGNKNATPVGVWLDAQNLKSYKSSKVFFDDGTPAEYIPGGTGKPANNAGIDINEVPEEERKNLRLLLKRGGKHGSDVPNFSQMNLKQDENGNKVTSSKDGALPHNKLVFEIECGMDEEGDLTDFVKENGRMMKGKNQGLAEVEPNKFYFFKTNSNAVGNWGIAGTFRIKRLVPHDEIVEVCEKAGVPVQKWVGGYHPEDFGLSVESVNEMYENGKKQKLMDAVTYDDNGNVIPLSERFSEKEDLRFLLGDEGETWIEDEDGRMVNIHTGEVYKSTDATPADAPAFELSGKAGRPSGKTEGTMAGTFEKPVRAAGEGKAAYSKRLKEWQDFVEEKITLSSMPVRQMDERIVEYNKRLEKWRKDNILHFKKEKELTEASLRSMLEDGIKLTGEAESDYEATTMLADKDYIGREELEDMRKKAAKSDIRDMAIEYVNHKQAANFEDSLFINDIRQHLTKEERKQMIFILEGDWNFEDNPVRNEVLEYASMISDWYDSIYEAMGDADALFGAGRRDNYVTHMWDKNGSNPEAWNTFIKGKYKTVRSRYTRERSIPTYAEGIKAGLKPKYDDICDIMTEYGRLATQSINNKRFIDYLKTLKVNGKRVLIEHGTGESGYTHITSNALEDYDVLKDVKEQVAAVLGSEPAPEGIMAAYDTWSSLSKRMKLSLSLFHHTSLTESAVSTMGPKALNVVAKNIIWDTMADAAKKTKSGMGEGSEIERFYQNLTSPALRNPELTREAVRHLVQLGVASDYDAHQANSIFTATTKWLREQAEREDIDKIIAGGAETVSLLTNIMSEAAKGMDTMLWTYLHDTYKLYAFEKMSREVYEAYEKGKIDELTKDMRLDEVGQLVNDNFGGQNWEVLGVSPKALRIAQRILLSPDWTISSVIRQPFAFTGAGNVHDKSYGGKKIRAKYGSLVWVRFGIVLLFGNLINVAFRKKDEDEEKKKSEETGEPNRYELLYPEGMTWKDYTGHGNSKGKRTYIYIGRYDDGREMYLRDLKQAREVFEFFTSDGDISFPNAMLGKIYGKQNPVLQVLEESLTGTNFTGWDNEEIRSKDGWRRIKETARLAGSTLLPMSVNKEKEFDFIDLFAPTSRGYNFYRATQDFKKCRTKYKGDEQMLYIVYRNCLMNNIDAEAALRRADYEIESEEKKMIKNGVTSLEEAEKKFDKSEGKKRTAYEDAVEYFLRANEKRLTNDDTFDNFMKNVYDVDGNDIKVYDSLKTSLDLRADYEFRTLRDRAKAAHDFEKKYVVTPEEREAYFGKLEKGLTEEQKQHRFLREMYTAGNKANNRINEQKGHLSEEGVDREKLMERIRKIRANYINNFKN